MSTSRSIARASAISILAIIIFALCFTPWPITPTDLISR